MTLKIKLIITACLTAFLAVIIGAVINRVDAVQQTEAAAAVAETIVPTEELLPTETIAPATMTIAPVVDLAVVQEREAAYQAQVAEANQRLAEASAGWQRPKVKRNPLHSSTTKWSTRTHVPPPAWRCQRSQ